MVGPSHYAGPVHGVRVVASGRPSNWLIGECFLTPPIVVWDRPLVIEALGAPIPLLADVTVLATVALGVAVAVITTLGTLLGARAAAKATGQQAQATIEASSEQASATLTESTSTRFARWQLHKREVYGEFLDAGLRLRDKPSDSAVRSEYLSQCNRVMLVANSEMRGRMWPFVEEPERLQDWGTWKELVEALGEDARQGKMAD